MLSHLGWGQTPGRLLVGEVRVKIENGLVTATRVDKTVEVEVALAGTRQEK